jgi:hypothetical protein
LEGLLAAVAHVLKHFPRRVVGHSQEE